MRALDAVTLPQSGAMPSDSQTLSQRMSFSPTQDIHLIPSLINLLMSIEPEVIYAGHDNSKPDTSSSLLTSLNQLGERQLLSVVKWSKSLPGNTNLYTIAQEETLATFFGHCRTLNERIMCMH